MTDGGLGAEPPAARGYGGLGAKSPAAGRFLLIFWKKKAILIPLDHISYVSEPFESTSFLTFESQSKKKSCSVLLLLAI